MSKITIQNKHLKHRFTIESNNSNGTLKFGNAVLCSVNNPKYIDPINSAQSINYDDLKMLIIIDLPVLLPLRENKRFDLLMDNKKYKIYHKKKLRGEENFSTFNSSLLPNFSSLEILCEALQININDDKDDSFKFDTGYLIDKVIKRFMNILNLGQSRKIGFDIQIVNYEVHYYTLATSIFNDSPAFSMYVFYDGILAVTGDKEVLSNEEVIRFETDLLNEKLNLINYYDDYQIDSNDFIKSVDEFLNKFIYYCNQNPRTISKLKEEEVRDLLLVVSNCIFESGEGESFNYDGKLDFKIKNNKNQYEYVAGELKIWKGQKSFDEIFLQGTKKHSTGNESKIYLLVISDNKDIKSVEEKVLDFLLRDEKIKEKQLNELVNISSIGSNNLFYDMTYLNRKREITLSVAICDTYYEKV